MNAKLIAAALCFAAMLCRTACANHGTTSVSHDLGFHLLSAAAPGNVFERHYPTFPLPNHGIVLYFAGRFINQSTTASANVTMWYDWVDPRFPGQRQTGSQFSYDVPAGEAVSPLPSLTVQQLYFFPPEVGIHIQNNGPGENIFFAGVFSHQTTNVPEPSALALCATAIAAVSAIRRMRAAA